MPHRRAVRAIVVIVTAMTAAIAVTPAGGSTGTAAAQELVEGRPPVFPREAAATPHALPPVTTTRQPLLSQLLRRHVEEGSSPGLRSLSVAAGSPETGPASALTEAERADATPAPSASASPATDTALVAPSPTPVRARQPQVLLDAPAHQVGELAAALRALPEVAAAAGVVRGTLAVAGESGPEALTLAAVDPERFRPVTPQATADATAVWERLREGDAVFTHEAGTRLGLELGSTVVAAEAAVRVGAFAATGVPPIADVVVSRQAWARLGLEGQGSVLVAPADGVSADALEAAVTDTSGLEPVMLGEPEARRAFLAGDDTRRAFEPFTYLDHGDGLITIEPAWVERNIVSARVPLLTGPVRCHRLLIDQLRGALTELEAAGLGRLIDPQQYGGCHVARHIDFNPSLPLSMHAWGLAVDLNVSTNGLGRKPEMDPRVVEVFERWGFAWGGRWTRPDGMHFELAALLDPAGG